MGKRSILRPTRGGSVSYEEWQDEAACRGVDTDLFEVDEGAQRGRRQAEGQQERIAQGLKICSKCPVRKPCGASASEMDKYWTTRGGQPPEGLFLDSKRPAPEGVTSASQKDLKEFCDHGHKDWYYSPSGVRRCLPCRKIYDKQARERKNLRKAEAERLRGSSLGVGAL